MVPIAEIRYPAQEGPVDDDPSDSSEQVAADEMEAEDWKMEREEPPAPTPPWEQNELDVDHPHRGKKLLWYAVACVLLIAFLVAGYFVLAPVVRGRDKAAAGQAAAGQRATGQRATGQRATGQRATGQADAGQADAGQADAGQAAASQAAAESQIPEKQRSPEGVIAADERLEASSEIRADRRETPPYYSIHFPPNSSALDLYERESLTTIVRIIERNPPNRTIITGHTALIGTEESCLILSRERAKTVRDSLLSLSAFDESVIVTLGVGATEPVADNSTPQGRKHNRRVEIRLVY